MFEMSFKLILNLARNINEVMIPKNKFKVSHIFNLYNFNLYLKHKMTSE